MGISAQPPVCLVSPIPRTDADDWRAEIDKCVREAGMEPVDYSPAAVDNAACLLAFLPENSLEVLYQVAFAMGRGIRALVALEDDDEISRLDPRPACVRVHLTPQGIEKAILDITSKLIELTTGQSARAAQNMRYPHPHIGRSIRTPKLMVSTMDQAEALFDKFIADGLTERNIQRLLLEAGCLESWVEFRLQNHFGGW